MVKKLAFILLLISANSMVFPQQSFEKSLRLNGDQQYIEIPDADYLNPNSDTDLTIELMFKPAEKSIATLFAKWKCRESIEEHGTGIYFLINTNDTDTTEREYPIPDPEFFSLVRGHQDNSSWSFGTAGGEQNFSENNYNHLCFNIAKHSYVPSFFNGEENTIHFHGDSRYASPGQPLCIGGVSSQQADSLDNPFYFAGDIDEVRIWNRVRTRSEVLLTMHESLGEEYYTTADSGLVAYYKFEELENLGVGEDGETNDLFDYSVNANHAQVIGGGVLVETDWTVSIEEPIDQPLVTDYILQQNYPNPFNPSTHINFSIPESGKVTFKIYDTLGREVATILDKELNSGQHSIKWIPEGLASGFYIGHLISNNYRKSIKMLLEK